MATIVILFVYFLTMLSLPVFMWRRHRDSFSALRHVAIAAAAAVIACVVVHRHPRTGAGEGTAFSGT